MQDGKGSGSGLGQLQHLGSWQEAADPHSSGAACHPIKAEYRGWPKGRAEGRRDRWVEGLRGSHLPHLSSGLGRTKSGMA